MSSSTMRAVPRSTPEPPLYKNKDSNKTEPEVLRDDSSKTTLPSSAAIADRRSL